MPIRVSGMNSGMDTESIVSAMVSAYSTKKDKFIKAQTKLTWKQEAWKNVNSKVNNLFSSISSLRFSSAYQLKKTSVSNPAKATITPNSDAINGTQSLKINKLAKAGALTGGELKKTDGSKVAANTTMKELGYTGTNGSFEVKIGDQVKTLDFDENTTVSGVVNAFKSLGLNANFDEKNQRIFLNSTESGAEFNFKLNAKDSNGMTGLAALGLATKENANKDVYKETAKLAIMDSVDPKKIDETATKAAITQKLKDLGDKYKDLDKKTADYNDAKALVEYSEAKRTLESDPDDEDAKKIVEAFEKEHEDDDPAVEPLTAEEIIAKKAELETMESDIAAVKDSIKADKFYNIGKPEDYTDVVKLSDMTNKLYKDISFAVEMADDAATIPVSEGAVYIEGTDAEIELNGATFTSASNTFVVNNLTIQANQVTDKDEVLSITTSNDSQGLYDKIKDFLSQYNTLINEITKLYNADSSKGYEPLTDDEKGAMNDTEIEKWENKIKDAILRRDSTLSGVMSAMTGAMMRTYEINGEKVSLGTFGIQTLGTLNSEKNEQYAYHIAGDQEDSASSGKKDKLLEALSADPDKAVEFFKQLTSGLYKELDNKMKSTTISSRYVVYNDKEMASEYSNYTSTIKKWEDKIADMEDKYYKQFTNMEKQLAKIQNNASSVTSLLGQ